MPSLQHAQRCEDQTVGFTADRRRPISVQKGMLTMMFDVVLIAHTADMLTCETVRKWGKAHGVWCNVYRIMILSLTYRDMVVRLSLWWFFKYTEQKSISGCNIRTFKNQCAYPLEHIWSKLYLAEAIWSLNTFKDKYTQICKNFSLYLNHEL